MRYQPVCLALWRKRHASCPLDEFHSAWMKQARTWESARAWLEWENVNASIELAVHMDEPDGSLSLLAELRLTIREWQQAHRELGKQPFRFMQTEQRYQTSQSAIAGHLMAWFAYLVVPRASGSYGPTIAADLATSVLEWVTQIRGLTVPIEVAEELLDTQMVTGRVTANILQIADAIPKIRELPVFMEPLRKLQMNSPADITSLKLQDEPDKAAKIYEFDDETTRVQHAATVIESVLHVAAALAPKYEETIDVIAARQHPLVALLSEGPCANLVSVLAAIRFSLEGNVPKTASRMKDRQAFRELEDWRTLWKKFEELGEIPKPALYRRELTDPGRCRRGSQDRDPCYLRCKLLEQINPFGTDGIFKREKAGGIPARPRQAGNQARADRINDLRKYDRHAAGYILQ